jgi:hypothetical protein
VTQLSAMVFAQMQGEGRVEDIEPAAHRRHLFQRAGEDLHAATVADENHDFVALRSTVSSSCGSASFPPAGEIIPDQAEGLLAGNIVLFQQAEELMHIGHCAPGFVQRRAVGIPA